MIRSGHTWSAYESIESDMKRIIEYIPLETRQHEVYSFKLTDIIIRTCSQIDSLFKNMLRGWNFSSHHNKTKIERCKKIIRGDIKGMLTIKDYIEIFWNYLNLASVNIIIRKTNEALLPFRRIETPRTADDKIPLWWIAYNNLKHDFYKNIKQGTLQNAIAALSALFALNCKMPENMGYLILNGIITSPNFIHTGHLLNYVKKDPKLKEYNLLAKTDLFEYWLSYNEKTIGLTVTGSLKVGY